MRRILVLLKSRPDFLIAALIFCVALVVFRLSPVHQVTDSRYSMLVSQSLLKYGTFRLDHYDVPRAAPFNRGDYVMDGPFYQLEYVGDHIYYFFPPGTSVLSLPYVAFANRFGVAAANADDTYNHLGEIRIETGLAAILMAALAAVFYLTARLLLPKSWSVAVALGGASGSQVWSTASRALWSHTWAILLMSVVIYLLLASETKGRSPRPALLATLLAWSYFVRPNCSIFIVAVSLYLFLYNRKFFASYAITGAAWFVGFVVYSWHSFGTLLPSYYRASRLIFDSFPEALLGNLVSPARGLLVYVPILLFIIYLLIRYRKECPYRRLVWLAVVPVIVDVVAVSGFSHWWGGASFGARLCTETVPWLVLLGILGLKARIYWREKHDEENANVRRGAEFAAGAVLLALSVFINARGALSPDAWKWNEIPGDISNVRRRLWDWRHPQFLAGLIREPLDREYPLVAATTRIDFTNQESDAYVWYGWSGAESDFRWTEAREAAIVFALAEIKDMKLNMELIPFLAPDIHERQRVTFELNGQRIQSLVFTEVKSYQVSLTLPANLLRSSNVLTLELPDADSPERLGLSADERQLGVAVKSVEFKIQPAGQ